MKSRAFKFRQIATAFAASAAVLLSTQLPVQAQQVAELHDKLPDSVKSSGVIKVGAPRTIPPHVFLRDGQLVGIAVDLAKEMEPILGVKFEWNDMQWPGIIPGLQSGSIDVSMGMVSFKPERKEILNMIPYVRDGSSLLVDADRTDITDDPQTLCGQTVGAVQASNFVTILEAESQKCVANGKPEIKILQFSGNSAVQAAFQAKNVDAWIHTTVEMGSIVKALDGKAKMYTPKSEGWTAPPVTIAIAKDQSGLAEAIQGALQILVKDGRYKAAMETYDNGQSVMDSSEIVINP
jgi:polar amino acid transport system substrate-binding protein